MPTDFNLQDALILASDTLSFQGEQIVVGTGGVSKSIVFSNVVGALHFYALPANGTASIQLPSGANGTVGLLTAISAGTTAFSNGGLSFANGGGITWGLNGATLTATVVAGAGGGIAASAGTQLATSGTVSFANSNGITFGMSNSSIITASYTQSTAPAAISAGTTLASSGTISFANSNGISFGLNGNTLTANHVDIAGIVAGTQTATSGSVSFANSNGHTFGMNNSSVITISYAPSSQSWFDNLGPAASTFSVTMGAGNNLGATLSLQHVNLAYPISATGAMIILSGSAGTNFTNAVSEAAIFNLQMGAYTISGSTASLLSSAAYLLTVSSNATRGTQVTGARYHIIPFSCNMTPGDYMVAFNWRSMASDTLGNSLSSTLFRFSMVGKANYSVANTMTGVNDTNYWLNGTFTSTIAGLPASIQLSQAIYSRIGGLANQQPGFILLGA